MQETVPQPHPKIARYCYMLITCHTCGNEIFALNPVGEPLQKPPMVDVVIDGVITVLCRQCGAQRDVFQGKRV